MYHNATPELGHSISNRDSIKTYVNDLHNNNKFPAANYKNTSKRISIPTVSIEKAKT